MQDSVAVCAQLEDFFLRTMMYTFDSLKTILIVELSIYYL